MCYRFPHSLSVNKALVCFHMKEGLRLSRTSINLSSYHFHCRSKHIYRHCYHCTPHTGSRSRRVRLQRRTDWSEQIFLPGNRLLQCQKVRLQRVPDFIQQLLLHLLLVVNRTQCSQSRMYLRTNQWQNWHQWSCSEAPRAYSSTCTKLHQHILDPAHCNQFD